MIHVILCIAIVIFTYQGIMICLYTITDKSHYPKVGLVDACNVNLSLFANQSEQPFLQKFCGYTIFTFFFNEKHVLCTQLEIFCNCFNLMHVEPLKYTSSF